MWEEKYRPKTIDECVLSQNLKKELNAYVESEKLPHLLFYGNVGLGKSSVARCIANQRNANYLFLNAARDNGIDFLRTTITDYVTTVSLETGQKIVVMDESDGLSSSAQEGLKSFLEQFSETAAFIFTANYPNRLIDAIHSRCVKVSFDVDKNDFNTLGKVLFKRIKNILDSESVTYDNKILIKFLQSKFPDYRNTIISLESYFLKNGSIDEGILQLPDNGLMEDIVRNLQSKKFDELTKLVFSAGSLDYQDVMMHLFENRESFVTKTDWPLLTVILGKYAHTDRFVPNKRMNIIAMLSEIICEVGLQ
jgi:replication factor C small subunit